VNNSGGGVGSEGGAELVTPDIPEIPDLPDLPDLP
jgi:hypothetical protein